MHDSDIIPLQYVNGTQKDQAISANPLILTPLILTNAPHTTNYIMLYVAIYTIL